MKERLSEASIFYICAAVVIVSAMLCMTAYSVWGHHGVAVQAVGK